MDGFSLIIGGALGILAGWAFSTASHKQRDANKKSQRATKASEEVSKKKGEAKVNREGSFADSVQGFLLYALGAGMIVALGAILFGSMI